MLWVKRTDRDLWNLPGGGGENEEPPWETAVRETLEETGCHVRLGELTSINSYTDEPNITFTFTAEIVGGQLTIGPRNGRVCLVPARGRTNQYPTQAPRTCRRCLQTFRQCHVP